MSPPWLNMAIPPIDRLQCVYPWVKGMHNKWQWRRKSGLRCKESIHRKSYWQGAIAETTGFFLMHSVWSVQGYWH